MMPLIHPFQPVASTINTLAGALYQVFCASPDPARKEMREACFDYLSLGGVFSSGPVSLLSGLNPRPLSLFCHFFAVAIYGVTRLLIPFPSPKRIWIGVRLITVHISRDLHINLHSPWAFSNSFVDYISTFNTTGSSRHNFSHNQGWRSETNVLSCNNACILQSPSYAVKAKEKVTQHTIMVLSSMFLKAQRIEWGNATDRKMKWNVEFIP